MPRPYCEACGYPLTRAPLRTFDITLKDLVGRTQAEVVAALGEPDSKTAGIAWVDSSQGLGTYVRVMPNGTVVDVKVFGPVPRRIAPLVPYEVWEYKNVRLSNWLLYLTDASATPLTPEVPTTPPAARWARWWQRLRGGETRHGPNLAPRVPRDRLWPSGALRVAEVASYHIGAHF